MPRNGSGTASIPNTFSPSTAISSAAVNANFVDVADMLTKSLATNGESSMTGPLKAADGSAAAPGIAFGADANTGFYRSASGTVKVVSDGTVVATFDSTGFSVGTGLANTVPDDSITNAKLAEMADDTIKGNLSGASANPSDISLADLAAALIATGSFVGVPSGAVSAFAMSTVPSGWLECNGSAVSRTTYATLFTAIGTTYGAGDGSTTFTLPDLRGEFVRGWDHSRGIDSGRAIGTAQDDAMQGHKHSITPAPQVGSGLGYSGTSGVNGSSTTQTGTPVTDGTNGTPRTAAETRPRNVAMMYCIKV